MKIKSIIKFGILALLIAGCNNKIVYDSAKSNSQCSDLGGYWYNDKCWKDFDDDGISKTKIDSTVAAQMKVINTSKLVFDNKTYPLIAFLPVEEDEGILIVTVYGTKDNYKTLIFPTGKETIKNEILETTALLFDGDAISGTLDEASKQNGTATVNIIDLDNLNIEISGKISNNENSQTKDFSFKANEAVLGAGNSHIEIKGNEAYLSCDLGTVTYSQIKNLIETNPEVKTIVMTQISGSVNDAVNMHTGRLLHENGFTTKLLSDSDIASGGVDLFCAGKKRVVEKGAKIGVHSWCCVNEFTAIELPKEHPAHQYQVDYFTMVLGAEKGPAFYFYTLEAAAFDDIHYMTDEEIEKWNIATDFRK
jgi:hypothetical protein